MDLQPLPLGTLIRIEGIGENKDRTGRLLKVTDTYTSVLIEGVGVRLFNRTRGRVILEESHLSSYRLPETIVLRLARYYPVAEPVARPERPIEAIIREDPEARRMYTFRERLHDIWSCPVRAWLELLRDTQYPAEPVPEEPRFTIPRKV